MHVHRSGLRESVTRNRTAVTVGSFDGLHLGHRQILSKLLEIAAAHGETPLAVTFDPHPRSLLLGDDKNISMLYSFDERMDLLSRAGIEHIYVIEFDEAFRKMQPREYAERIIRGTWNAGHIIAGYNHSFGKDRAGDHESLISLGSELGFGVEIVPPVVIRDEVVSSTAIRRHVMEGDMPLANTMLGRKFSFTGRIIRGFARGRRMGCPTANLGEIVQGKIVPRDGIYAAIAEHNDFAYPAAVSIGFNPTFGGQRHSIEAHLLDFDADIYDHTLTLRMVKRLRGEIKFSGEDSLSVQMKQDIADIRAVLSEEGYSLEPRRLSPQEKVI